MKKQEDEGSMLMMSEVRRKCGAGVKSISDAGVKFFDELEWRQLNDKSPGPGTGVGSIENVMT